MTEPFEQQLLGYLLEALPEDERLEVDRAITREPALLNELDRLQAMLAPLAADIDPYTPPAGLAEATCAMIAELDESRLVGDAYGEDKFADNFADNAAPVAKIPVAMALASAASSNGNDHHKNGHHKNGLQKAEQTKFGLSPATRSELSGFGRRQFRLREFVTVFALASIAVAMLVPAIGYSRYNAEIAGCQNNLREVGLALSMYSQSHEGYFPIIPTGTETVQDRKAGVAGIFAVKLAGDGLLTDHRLLTCPAVRHEGDGVIIPTMQQLAHSESFLHKFQTKMAGDYGYNLGHEGANGEYLPTRNLNRDNFPIIGDTPSVALDGKAGDNHGIWGQNFLFESGRVAFLRNPDAESGVDNPFQNDAGQVAAGKDWRDAVIAPSFARPGVYALK